MEATKFDLITRMFGRRVSRRTVMKAAALGGVVAATPISFNRASAQTSPASALIEQFYETIDAYQYSEAYALLGSKWHSQQSLDTFTKGYANTAFVQCSPTSEKVTGANTVVSVNLMSWHNDGNIVSYAGSYTVGMENGTLLILAGDNTASPAPPGVKPLCKISDLKITFGPWNAGTGNRDGSLIATNVGGNTCVLGGSPRITIKDAHKYVLRSTSAPGSLAQAVVIGPGDAAHAPLRFSNWCGDSADGVSVYADIPADNHEGTVNASDSAISFPPCLGKGQPALLEVKGWVAGQK